MAYSVIAAVESVEYWRDESGHSVPRRRSTFSGSHYPSRVRASATAGERDELPAFQFILSGTGFIQECAARVRGDELMT
jgi:hypothetical protein